MQMVIKTDNFRINDIEREREKLKSTYKQFWNKRRHANTLEEEAMKQLVDNKDDEHLNLEIHEGHLWHIWNPSWKVEAAVLGHQWVIMKTSIVSFSIIIHFHPILSFIQRQGVEVSTRGGWNINKMDGYYGRRCREII